MALGFVHVLNIGLIGDGLNTTERIARGVAAIKCRTDTEGSAILPPNPSLRSGESDLRRERDSWIRKLLKLEDTDGYQSASKDAMGTLIGRQLDANRTPEFVMRMLLSRRYSDIILSADPKLHNISIIALVFVCFD